MPTPWIVSAAVDFIEKTLTDKSVILEFGSGGSTQWFADRCHKIVTVDHDRKYYDDGKDIPNCKAHLVESKHIAPTDLTEVDYSFIVGEYPDKYFDMILVDGRNRVNCFLKSLPKLKKGGYIILDNSEREEYKECFNNDMEVTNYIDGTWTTTIWKK